MGGNGESERGRNGDGETRRWGEGLLDTRYWILDKERIKSEALISKFEINRK